MLSLNKSVFSTEPGFFDDSKEHLPQDDVGGHKPSFTMPNPLGLQDENTKSSDKYTSYEELRRRNRNQWMTPKQKPSTDNSRLDQVWFLNILDIILCIFLDTRESSLTVLIGQVS